MPGASHIRWAHVNVYSASALLIAEGIETTAQTRLRDPACPRPDPRTPPLGAGAASPGRSCP